MVLQVTLKFKSNLSSRVLKHSLASTLQDVTLVLCHFEKVYFKILRKMLIRSF